MPRLRLCLHCLNGLAGIGIKFMVAGQRLRGPGLDFAIRLIGGLFDIVLNPFEPLLELNNSFTQAASHFRQTLAEDEQSKRQNDHPFGPAWQLYRQNPGRCKRLNHGVVLCETSLYGERRSSARKNRSESTPGNWNNPKGAGAKGPA